MKFLYYVQLCFIIFINLTSCTTSEPRIRKDFDESWKFSLTDSATHAQMADFDDSGWRVLDLPHDWSIEGEFSDSHPATPGGRGITGRYWLVS